MGIELKIKNLVKKLQQWEHEYYNLANPSVSDAEYDLNLQELIQLENDYPQFKLANSPTQRVGGVVSDKFSKVKHSERMMSLGNAFDHESLNKFNEDIKKIIQEIKGYVVEPKIDGLSIALIYEKGYLKTALTRGDGEYGENVTNNAKTIRDIPLKIAYRSKIEIRGEIYLPINKFNELNKSVDTPFANPRNAAAGTMRNLDSSIVAKRQLGCFLYTIVDPNSHGLKTQFEVIEFLKKLGFKTSELIEFKTSIEDVWTKINAINDAKKNLNYECDGIVVKYNDMSKYEDIGYTAKYPKWAIAYKFPAEIKQSILRNIILSVGRTGRINYVAKIDKVEINGTMVSNATLHNYDYIESKDIRINDHVNVFKAGEIIPKIISVDSSKRSGIEFLFPKPTNCPSCHQSLINYENEVDLYCTNNKCDQKIIEAISHFCSRDAMAIDGMSIKIVEKLYNEKIITNWIDLYELENKKTLIIEKDLLLKEKSLNNLFAAINKSKNNSLEKLLFGLGIRHIGATAAKKLAKTFRTLEKLAKASFDDLANTIEIGDKMAGSIIEYFKVNNYESFVEKLNFYNINHIYKTDETMLNIKQTDLEKFSNKKLMITGSFDMSRKTIKTILEDNYGIKVVSSLSNKTNFLLIGENPTVSKIEKAKELKIEIIKEEFWKN